MNFHILSSLILTLIALSVPRNFVLYSHPSKSMYPWHCQPGMVCAGQDCGGVPCPVLPCHDSATHCSSCLAAVSPCLSRGARSLLVYGHVWAVIQRSREGKCPADSDEAKGYLLSQMSVSTLCSHGCFLWSALWIPVSTTHLLQDNIEKTVMKRYFWSFTKLHYLITKICQKS